MQTIERTTGTAAQRPFGLVKGFVVAYGAMGAAVFGTIVALAAADGPASGFMWTRSALVPVSAAIMYWLVTLAARARAALTSGPGSSRWSRRSRSSASI